ncbi:MAG: hypothetical protein QFB86_00135 [Patescibacteria group bacterium]|nr:hypothetical protein [Patescibacteria group bacterium]
MDNLFWLRQKPDKPLYADMLWSRPENKRHAGKLLLVGGNVHGFAAAGEAYSEAIKAGIGTARVLLPDSLQKTVGRVFEAGEYAASTPSGSFSQKALAEFIDMASWSDGVLLAGDLARNSETAILIEHFTEKYRGQLTFTKDAADYILSAPGPLMVRENTLLVLSFAQLQKLAVGARYTRAFTTDMDLLRLIDALHEFTTRYNLAIITRFHTTILVAFDGRISTTPVPEQPLVWRLKTASHAAVWWLQHPAKTFEALTTSLIAN